MYPKLATKIVFSFIPRYTSFTSIPRFSPNKTLLWENAITRKVHKCIWKEDGFQIVQEFLSGNYAMCTKQVAQAHFRGSSLLLLRLPNPSHSPTHEIKRAYQCISYIIQMQYHILGAVLKHNFRYNYTSTLT